MSNSSKARELVEAFSTGSSKVLDYVSDEKYIQHNLSFPDGKSAIVGFFADEATGIDIKVHRVFEEGDLVALHSTYGGAWNNGSPQVAIDVFRFEDGLIVEHWDNLLDVAKQNPSGRTQVDGVTAVSDKNKQEANKKLIQELMDVAFIGGDYSEITKYISPMQYLQHNPAVADGLDGFNNFVSEMAEQNIYMKYSKCYQIIADGNFVLTLADGTFGDQEVAYYDLFRIYIISDNYYLWLEVDTQGCNKKRGGLFNLRSPNWHETLYRRGLKEQNYLAQTTSFQVG